MYADEHLKAMIVQEGGALTEKVLRPSLHKEMAKQVINDYQITVKLACQAFKISETYYWYNPKLSTENDMIADWILRLTTTRKQWGFGFCLMHLIFIRK
jgi:putative transposase